MKRSELLRAYKRTQERLQECQEKIQRTQDEAESLAAQIKNDHELVDMLMGQGVREYDGALFVMDKGKIVMSTYIDTPLLWDIDRMEEPEPEPVPSLALVPEVDGEANE